MTEQSSTETNELATALAKARPEMPHPIKNCKNPHFNNEYADQKAIMDAISPAMGKHGLSLTFQPDGEALMMHGYLRHSSGQWLRASLPLILGNRRDMQALGAAITYAKRYLTGALLSLHHDTDDDAESVMPGPAKAKRAPRSPARGAKKKHPANGYGTANNEKRAPKKMDDEAVARRAIEEEPQLNASDWIGQLDAAKTAGELDAIKGTLDWSKLHKEDRPLVEKAGKAARERIAASPDELGKAISTAKRNMARERGES